MMRKTQSAKRRLLWTALIFCFLLSWSVPAGQAGEESRSATGREAMVATAHPLASQAAIEMLRKGGNAVDAAVAAAFTIGVVEPDGSGMGGGGGMLIRLKSGKAVYINYYPRASSRVMETGFEYGKDNQTAKAIMVPGNAAGLTAALKKFGTLPLRTVLEPAIRFAEQGFAVDATLSKIILDNVTLIEKHPATAAVYFRDGFPLQEGDLLRQPELAKTLKGLARKGAAAFYQGPVAQALVDETSRAGGRMTLADLKNFRATFDTPVHGTYRGYQVLSAPPPHSGAMVIEALNILENADLKPMGFYSESAESFHLLAEAIRRVYADRTSYLADPKFEYVPVQGLLSKLYAKKRFQEIDPKAVTPPDYRRTPSGDPAPFDAVPGKGRQGAGETRGKAAFSSAFPSLADAMANFSLGDPEPLAGSTTHISILDRQGNMVSLTQTLGTFFGSGVTAAGVLLNNAMSNFATGNKVNCIQPGKQPRSSIAPSILLKDNRPFLVIGSPGAARIVNTVVTLIVNVVDYGMDAEEANRAPRFLCQKSDPVLSLEARFRPEVQEAMKKKGHRLQLYGDFDLFFGGAQIILARPDGGVFQGSADPRRGGVALGF